MADANKKYITKEELTTEIAYANLKSLRDSSGLTPGMWYRITDYVATTTQYNTQSAGHPFDIIVVADDVHKLNENARAALHAGDTYFSGSTLEAWELKYCLDNDPIRFKWAKVLGIKCSAQTSKTYYDNGSVALVSGMTFYGFYDEMATGVNTVYAQSRTPSVNDTLYIWSQSYDPSTGQITSIFTTYGVVSEVYDQGKGVIYEMEDENGNFCGYDFKNIMFKTGNNKPVAGISGNVFYYTFSYLLNGIIKDHSLTKYCYGNKIFKDGQLQRILAYNIFKNNASSYYCRFNILINSESNCFGNYCTNNSLNSSFNNVFGNNCQYNTLGMYSASCIFGNYSIGNIIENYVSSVVFGESSSSVKSYYRYITVESGNQYIYLNCTGTTSSSSYYQNVTIAQGVNNTSSWKTITDGNVNQNYQTIFANDASGNAVSVNIADIAGVATLLSQI